MMKKQTLIWPSHLQCKKVPICNWWPYPLLVDTPLGTATNVKLVTKIKKLNQHYFGTLKLPSYCYCGDIILQRIKLGVLSKHWLQRKQQYGTS